MPPSHPPLHRPTPPPPAAGRGPLLLGGVAAKALLGARGVRLESSEPSSLAHHRTPEEAQGGKVVVRKSRAPQAAPRGVGQGLTRSRG